MAPNGIAKRMQRSGVAVGVRAPRQPHLPPVLDLASSSLTSRAAPSPTTTTTPTLPFCVLLLLLLVVFVGQAVRRRLGLSRAHHSIRPRRDAEKDDKTRASCIMANDNKKQAPKAAPAAVLRPRARTPTPHAGPSRTISLPQGRYTGVVLPAPLAPRASVVPSSSDPVPHAVEAWRGIPYAQTTGGANRFRPPVPLSPYAEDGHVVADTFGPVCPSSASDVVNAWEGEDCLNLNVYRPASYNDSASSSSSSGQKLPVIIYVHGGAFNSGAGTERNMASFVSWAATPLVAVSFNYRVGALGFPSSVEAEQEGCLNLGLRDQRMLFEWVRQNIDAFGGDGGRVTIMGMSAGAHSIGYHLQSYTDPCQAPFQAAIMESGGATARATLSPQHPRTASQWREFLREAGVDAAGGGPELFAKLRALPLETILRASNTVFARYQDPIRWPFQPVVENDARNGELITDLPIVSFRRGRFLRIPILTGFNTNEGTVFCSPRVDTNDDFVAKFTFMVPGLGHPSDQAALCQVYPDPNTTRRGNQLFGLVPPGFGRQWARYEAAYSHYAYICPVLQTGHFYSSSSTAASSAYPAPVWVYHFAALSRPDFGGKANHVDEAVLVSHDMDALAPFPGLVATSDVMHGAFVRFIATGNPNPPSLDVPTTTTTSTKEWWPRFTSPLQGDSDMAPRTLSAVVAGQTTTTTGSPRGEVMVFGADNDERMGGAHRGTPASVRSLSEDEVEQCRFWWERVELSEGMGKRLALAGQAKL